MRNTAERYLLFFLAGGDDGQLENATVLDGKGEIRAEKLYIRTCLYA